MYPLLTNINSQFIDDCGKPLAGGKVYTYEANTTTPKLTYADTNGQSPNTNPIILDESGRANIYMADGAYRIRVLDKKDALVADTPKISRYVTNTELETFIQNIEAGLSELEQVKESLDIFVNAAIAEQKGAASGLAPLDMGIKIDPFYLPAATIEKQGAVKLNNTLLSDSATDAATAAMAKKLNDEKLAITAAFGIGQTYQDVTASRVIGTTYTNSDAKARLVIVQGSTSNGSIVATVDGEALPAMNIGNNLAVSICTWFIVLPTKSYKVEGASLARWVEMKL